MGVTEYVASLSTVLRQRVERLAIVIQTVELSGAAAAQALLYHPLDFEPPHTQSLMRAVGTIVSVIGNFFE